MLGVALTAQRAGWGSTPFQVLISSDSTITQSLSQTPAFSFLANVSNRNLNLQPGEYNLGGYKDISGFNNRRSTQLVTVYLDWPTGLSDGYYGTPLSNTWWTAGVYQGDANIVLNIDSGQLRIDSAWPGGGPTFKLTGAYTNYINRWITIVVSSAETSSVYSNWVPPEFNSGANYVRIAVYDTETGALLGKQDSRDDTTRPDFSSWGNTAYSTGSTGEIMQMFGFGGNDQEFRTSTIWYSFGTMFDPLSVADQSWRTLRLPETIGSAKAWLNVPFTTYFENASSIYFTDEENSIFTPAITDEIIRFAGGDDPFSAGEYSTTIIPKDKS